MAGGTDIEPRFAERAAGLLDRGDVPAALSLLLAGLKQYPGYATAHVLLGRCYERLGKAQDAAHQFVQARRILPGLSHVGAEPQQDGGPESGVEFMLRRLPHVHVRPDAGTTEQSGTPSAGEEPGVRAGAGTDAALPIVSATLAEIYADQGRYREAVEAYNRLAQQRPADAGRYRERLAELERLLQGVDKLGEA
ncbi:hypothetical protein ANRL2_04033 [Anaerolineae bacterium]|nr:hypothetical protein ANRL2_04033 [Anaerolineae bacterium]